LPNISRFRSFQPLASSSARVGIETACNSPLSHRLAPTRILVCE
jgi:hypothetical protein